MTPRDTSSNRRPEGLDCLELGSSPGNRMSSFVGAACRRPLFWCLMAAICASPPADAQTPAQMGGTIQDPTGAPISEMTITLKGAAERVTLSGPDGRFAFENLPAGEYELRGVLDSVTVTAPRTGQRDVQATPLAVTVLSGIELQRVQSPSVEDVSGRAPAVNDAIEQQSPYGLLDASLEIASRHWSAGPYARNLTNEGYITATSNFPPPAIGGRPGEPRQVGVQLTLRR
jgi:carboxypeptidase family protein